MTHVAYLHILSDGLACFTIRFPYMVSASCYIYYTALLFLAKYYCLIILWIFKPILVFFSLLILAFNVQPFVFFIILLVPGSTFALIFENISQHTALNLYS